jgi:3-deoxy-manno-octulosonate cytidylyltransferase (CMP-KDO synthetase)
MALIVIPARYSSTRFPGKPLALINGLPMVVQVYTQAIKSKLAKKVIIATDDKRIFNCAKDFHCDVQLTSNKHKSGTDRVAEVAMKLKEKIVVNVQGDEPFIKPEVIDNAIKCLQSNKDADISTPVKKISNKTDIENVNVVKVVFSEKNYAIYFSRSPIPFYRENNSEKEYFKHIGLYAFRIDTLMKFVNLKESKLEEIEKLEQLRAIENNMKIKVFKTDYESIGIDTPEDLKSYYCNF